MLTGTSNTLAYYEHNRQRYAERARGRLDLAALQEFCRRLPAGGRVLDAGCGTGRDLRYFNRAGFAAEGFDVSPAMVELAGASAGTRVWTADLRLVSLARETYDGVWANRSLIHLRAPECQRAMASFFAALKPGGTLFVSLEAGETEGETRLDRTDDPTGPSRMIYLYRPDDFASLIRQNGFRVELTGGELGAPDRVGFIARRI